MIVANLRVWRMIHPPRSRALSNKRNSRLARWTSTSDHERVTAKHSLFKRQDFKNTVLIGDGENLPGLCAYRLRYGPREMLIFTCSPTARSHPCKLLGKYVYFLFCGQNVSTLYFGPWSNMGFKTIALKRAGSRRTLSSCLCLSI